MAPIPAIWDMDATPQRPTWTIRPGVGGRRPARTMVSTAAGCSNLGAMKVSRLLDIGASVDDERDLRIRKRTAVASVLVFMAVAVVYAVSDVSQFLPASLAAIQLGAFSVALVVFHRT